MPNSHGVGGPAIAIDDALQQLHESLTVDYKGPSSWVEADKPACCALVKDLIAFANGDGGYIIVGVEEHPDHTFELKGLEPEQLATWEQTRLANFVDARVEPRVRFSLRVHEFDGKRFVAIAVTPFDDLPHLCVRKPAGELRDMTLYIRNEKNESAPVKTAADMNRVIERAVRNRQDRLLESFRSILTGATVTPSVTDRERFEEQIQEAEGRDTPLLPQQWTGVKGFRCVSWYLSVFSADRFSLPDLRKALEAASPPLRGWPFLYTQQRDGFPRHFQHGVEGAVAWSHPVFPPVRHYQYWRAYTSGTFFQRTLMREDGEQFEPGRVLWVDETALHIAEAIVCMTRVYEALGIRDEDVTLRMRLDGIEGRLLMYMDRARGGDPHSVECQSSTLSWVATHAIEDWRAGSTDLALEGTEYLVARCGWVDPDVSALRPMLDDLVHGRMR